MTVNIVSVLVRECLAKQTVTLQFFPVGGDCIALGRSPPSYIVELVDEVLEDGQAPEFHQLVDLGDLETMLQIPLEGWCPQQHVFPFETAEVCWYPNVHFGKPEEAPILYTLEQLQLSYGM